MFSTLKDQITSLVAFVTDEDEAKPFASPCLSEQANDEETITKEENVLPNQAGYLRDLPSAAITHVKSLGTSIFSAITDVGTKLKRTVEENAFLREFNKEQYSFIRDLGKSTTSSALPPWVGYTNEVALKEMVLALSHDRRNFFRNPPEGVDFHFDYETSYPIAEAIMEHDDNLAKTRYELVPMVMKEEEFWRNYFYRVSLVCRAEDISCVTNDDDQTKDMLEIESDSEDATRVAEDIRELSLKCSDDEEEWEKELETELLDYEADNEKDRIKSEDSEDDVEA